MIPQEQFCLENVDERYKQLAEILGDKLTDFIKYYGGSTLYVPCPNRIITEYRKKQIIDAYNGYNTKELARKWGVSERWVQILVKGTN